MNIMFFEDNDIQAQLYKEILFRYSNVYQIDCKIITTKDSKYLLEKVKDNLHNNLIFLDLEIDKDLYAGLNLAKEIRAIDRYSIIIIISANAHLMKDVFKYKVGALDFIDKKDSLSNIEQQIHAHLDYYFESIFKESSKYKILSKNNESILVYYEDIILIQTTGIPHKLQIISKDRQIICYGNIKDFLNSYITFIQTHKSYIVNTKYIKYIDKKNKIIHLLNGHKAYISRKYYRNFLNSIK